MSMLGQKRSNRFRRRRPLQAEGMEPRLMMTVPAVTAQAAIVTTGAGDVVGELNAHEQRHMASTTKIMTALVAIEESAPGNSDGLSLNGTVQVGFYPANLDFFETGSYQGFDVGDRASLHEMLYSTMLESDNEAAQAVAEHIAIHQPDASSDTISQNVPAGWALMADFADLMNAKAEDLGMSNTSYRTPDGAQYIAEGMPGHGGHYSTAYDLATLARYAMGNQTFYDLVGTAKTEITVNGDEDRELKNGNQLIRNGQYAYPGAEGLKTGNTPVAGHCLVAQATLLGRTINTVVLGSPSGGDRFEDTHALLDYGFEQAYGFTVEYNADVGAWEVTTKTATYNVDTRILTINGTNGPDDLSLDFESGKLRVDLNGVDEEFPFADLGGVVVAMAGGGDDMTVIGDVVPFPIDIDGGSGFDRLEAVDPVMLGAITGDTAGTLIEGYHGISIASFTHLESVQPDDYANSLDAAQTLDLMRGCQCNVDVDLHGFMGGVNDQDWTRLDIGSGMVSLELTTIGPHDANPILQLWNVSESDNPVFVDSVAANAPATNVAVTHGEYALRVRSNTGMSEYQVTASVPSASLKTEDLLGIPTKMEDFWPRQPHRETGGRLPGPDPMPIENVVQRPVESHIQSNRLLSTADHWVALRERRAGKKAAALEDLARDRVELDPALVDDVMRDVTELADTRFDRSLRSR